MPTDNPGWTHAGGVVYRDDRGERQMLLVRGTRPPHDWVLPKGHIDPGETALQAAVREVREEAGVEAEPVQLLGEIEFTVRSGSRVHAAFYLMKFTREVPADEDREATWCTFAEALTLTPFPNTHDLLRAAEALTRK